MKLKTFMINAFVPYTSNPGWNLTAIITICGVILLGTSALLSQVPGYGQMDPIIVELGRAAFYSGIGRASVPKQEAL